MEQFLARLPKEARSNYFEAADGTMFLWTVEPFNLMYPDQVAQGKYESVVYRPYGKGSRSGQATRFRRDESTASLHVLRRDAKARALRLLNEHEGSSDGD